jgi:chromosome segregation ATPase
MFDVLKGIVGVGLAAVLFVGGYKVGGRKVDELEAQLKSIEGAAAIADAKLKSSQDEMDKALKAREAEYAKQSEALKGEAERKAKELSSALAGANARVARQQAEIRSNNAKREKLVAQMAAASEAEKKDLQAQIDALDGMNKTLAAKADANACLALAVPAPVIEPLMVRQ